MMKSLFKKRIKAFAFFFAIVLLCLFMLPFTCKGESFPIHAKAYTNDLIKVEKYDADFTIEKDRKIKVVENFTVTFLQTCNMFYRSFPTEGCLYENIKAKCEGNPEFYYEVAENKDVEGFFDVNCWGGARRGQTWEYEITYVMQDGVGAGDGMIIDLTGFGWQIPLYNVSLNIHFPEPLTDAEYNVYVGSFGVGKEDSRKLDVISLSEDGKTLLLQEDKLERIGNCAEGITLEFFYGGGVFENYTKTRLFTDDIFKLLLCAGIVIALSVALLLFTRRKREMITVVNVTAPDQIDPMKMGTYLDGKTDTDDVTSMIYYFAHKGYLKIDLSDSKDPKLITSLMELPLDAPIHQKTLFNGLFRSAKTVASKDPFDSKITKEIRVSELKGNFFDSMKLAKEQTPSPKPMYEKKSIFGYIGGGILSLLTCVLATIFMGLKVGGGYLDFSGVFLCLPVCLILAVGYIKENYRYKWKKKIRFIVTILTYLFSLFFALFYLFGTAEFFMTEYEKAVVVIATFGCCLLTQNALSRTEKYVEELGQILGFKEFIVVTEEDKIKVMLEENPELYYKILPYAQALGVTNEWEKKFESITMQPPTWYVGDFTFFDYLLLRSCMRSAMMRSMSAAMQQKGGRFVGRSGGGGSFGGFGGGGFGGGGGGAR